MMKRWINSIQRIEPVSSSLLSNTQDHLLHGHYTSLMLYNSLQNKSLFQLFYFFELDIFISGQETLR